MLDVRLDPYRLVLRETVGLSHETQVVEVPVPTGSPAIFHLRDEGSGSLFPVQSSRRKPGFGYLFLSVAPDQTLSLVPADQTAPEQKNFVSWRETADTWSIGNGNFEIELSSGQKRFAQTPSRTPLPGPLQRVRVANGPWRGRTFFDTLNTPVSEKAEWLEQGPLRTVYHYRVEFTEEGFYDLEVTADAGLDLVRFHETFRGAASDQLVWDFSGADLPNRLSLLDSSAGYTTRWLHYHLDQRHARLWCWSQFSQLHDLSDGFALHFDGSDDVLGLVSLEGGKWRGNALNHVEAWTRRWQASDPTTRRLPGDAKADSFPGIDRIPARGESVCQPHFTLEAWLRQGERNFALVLSREDRINPAILTEGSRGETGFSVALGHFEGKPRRDLYSRLQARLRKIHIQHGMLPLQDQLGLAFDWPLEKNFMTGGFALRQQAKPEAHDPDGIQVIDDSLQARVYGFWEGAGAAYSNCVVSRRVGPDMVRFEKLASEGKLNETQITRWRAWFVFMAHLYHSDNFYPGPSSMEPVGALNTMEPTIAGMANQNFYTDVITLSAFAGQVFPGHPSAAGWREKFLVNWHRQLEYHMYPKSGVWEESHTYYQHVMGTVLPLLVRRKADGTGDDFADARFQKLVAAAIPQLTPRDPITGGSRHLVTFGDHEANPKSYASLYRGMALGFVPHAPELAGQCAWVYQEMSGGEVPAVRAIRPLLQAGRLEGMGFFFRGENGADGESLLALRSGMAWGHHHHDDGSIQFYAHGHALIIDSAASDYQEREARKVESPGHSRSTVDGVEPLNHLWRFNRGWILESNLDGDLPYAVAGTPTFCTLPPNLPVTPLLRAHWGFRAVVELGPAVYLIVDHLDPAATRTVRFHVAHAEVALEENRVSAAFAPDCRLEIIPLFRTAPPALSQDRPLYAAKVPVESTTSVEYGGITDPWSVFVLAALPLQDRLNWAMEPGAPHVTAGGKIVEISRRGKDILHLATNAGPGVELDAPKLLAQLRAASR